MGPHETRTKNPQPGTRQNHQKNPDDPRSHPKTSTVHRNWTDRYRNHNGQKKTNHDSQTQQRQIRTHGQSTQETELCMTETNEGDNG